MRGESFRDFLNRCVVCFWKGMAEALPLFSEDFPCGSRWLLCHPLQIIYVLYPV